MRKAIDDILHEVEKAIVGKRSVLETVLMALLSGGHVLLDDVPGVGKTTLAVALSKALGLNCRRVQCTPDVLPSDIVGFSMYDKESGQFRYVPGVAVGANLLLADEINRTASKTQSALLEAMEEGQVTVDGAIHPLEKPFCVLATQNQIGTAGTQPLPHAQMDRFLVRLTIGYPDHESQMELIRDRQTSDPMDSVCQVSDREALMAMQKAVCTVTIKDSVIDYISRLATTSRDHPMLRLGISPRGALWTSRMAKAKAYLEDRDYVVPEDVRAVFVSVCAHRVLLKEQAQEVSPSDVQIMEELLRQVKAPHAL